MTTFWTLRLILYSSLKSSHLTQYVNSVALSVFTRTTPSAVGLVVLTIFKKSFMVTEFTVWAFVVSS
jgi:hypothetical protein